MFDIKYCGYFKFFQNVALKGLVLKQLTLIQVSSLSEFFVLFFLAGEAKAKF